MKQFRKAYGSKTEGSTAWYLQRISGLVIFILVLVHFSMMHFVEYEDSAINEYGSHYMTYETVAKRLANPFWKVFNILFLIFALYHAVNGAWQVLIDIRMPDGLRIAIHGALYILAFILLVIGCITIIPFGL